VRRIGLNARVITLPSFATLAHPAPGFPVLNIHHPSCDAQIALHGAHVLGWTPAGHEPVLYLSPSAVFEEGKAIRGGIPVCWPWFSTHPEDPAKPFHGFARVLPWELVECEDEGGCVAIRLALRPTPATRALWPHEFEAFVEIRAGAELNVALVTHNSDNAPRPEGGALHTYLQVGDIKQVGLLGLDGATYRDATAKGMRHVQEGTLPIDREIDRLYEPREDVTVLDPALGRKLVIHKQGANTVVVWNPWIEKSIRLADLPDEAYHNFICVEAANPNDKAVQVAPRGTHVLRTRIEVQPL
jgi:glucose-6-phosphate 1-epimerase